MRAKQTVAIVIDSGDWPSALDCRTYNPVNILLLRSGARSQNVHYPFRLLASWVTHDGSIIYNTVILTHLLNGEHAVALRAASDILALRGSLTAEEFKKTLNACTESRHFSDHSGLVPQLSKWLSSGVALDGESLEAVERGLTLLESAEEPVGNSIRPYPGPFLLLPLVLFIYAKRVDQKSCRVFMRGLRESLAPESAHRLPGIRPLIAVDPLLTQVPNGLLEQVFAFAEREDDPTIRVLGRVLRRVVKATTN